MNKTNLHIFNRLVFIIILLIRCNFSYATNEFSGYLVRWYENTACGLKQAFNNGNNGLLLSGYTYHFSAGAHLPTDRFENLNELTYGAGYSRSYYNKNTNEEYILFAIAFTDSYYKSEVHTGFVYQKYYSIFKSNLLGGIGYAPMIFIKPKWSNNEPMPLPGFGLSGSLKYKNFSLIATFANVVFMNAKIDF